MKKLLGIVVLGLLLSGCYATTQTGSLKSNANNNVEHVISSQSKAIDLFSKKSLKKIEGVWRRNTAKPVNFAMINSNGSIEIIALTYGKRFSPGQKFGMLRKNSEDLYSGKLYLKYRGEMQSANVEFSMFGLNSMNEYNVSEFGTNNRSWDRIWPENIKEHNAKFGDNSGGDSELSFTIADKKKQCVAIGFKPLTEKFADCVLKLVELDLKSQVNNPKIATLDTGTQQLANQLKRNNNMQQSQFLMNLGNQLLSPQSTVSAPTTTNCRVIGSGAYKTVNCW